jgi:spore coat protein CotF
MTSFRKYWNTLCGNFQMKVREYKRQTKNSECSNPELMFVLVDRITHTANL